ncbi:transcriptional regulator TACO1-like protein [Lipomyces arxii]|uniref:transcriptional regulator TACO1-like protein n=1 Tax=Lipomyces arxii TaxID=56418 RepID=UPI0034CFABDC
MSFECVKAVVVRPVCRTSVQRAARRGFQTSVVASSGHSKWATIKHTKAANDAARNIVATKFSRMIVSAAKIGGPDPSQNARLATTIEAAKKASVTKKVIESALKRASGVSTDGGKALDSVTYEAVGPNGSALIIEALTDSKARTFTSVRSCVGKSGCQLGPALFYFDRKGVIRINKRLTAENAQTPTPIEFDDIFEHAIEAGAEDIEEMEDVDEEDASFGPMYQIICEATETAKVAQEMKDAFNYEIREMGIEYVPKKESVVELNDDQGKTMQKLMSALDEIEDVQDVYTNAK